MICFVDASALVALIEDEIEGRAIEDRLQGFSRRLWSPMSCWEAAAALQNSYRRPVAAARASVMAYAEGLMLELVAIGSRELGVALDAYEVYGKGRHRAKLNFGDCFAYACAKTNDAHLVYVGGDFTHTDLA